MDNYFSFLPTLYYILFLLHLQNILLSTYVFLLYFVSVVYLISILFPNTYCNNWKLYIKKRCTSFTHTPHYIFYKIYNSNFKSFSFIQPILLKKRPNTQASTPGKIKQISIRPNQSMPVIPNLVPAAISEIHPV